MKFKPIGSPVPGTLAFRTDSNCAILVGREPLGPEGAMRWHLSISHNKRYPMWDEITEARYRLIPDEAMMAMILPSRDQYVNVHERCFHLYEIETKEAANINFEKAEPKICSVCDRPYKGFGNNARPINDGRCCDTCNWMHVIPTRVERLRTATP